MPELSDPQVWPLLAAVHNRRQTRREWHSVLGGAHSQSVPLLRIQGERAEFIRCPETGLPLEIHENWDGSFSALPPADTEIASRIDGLTLEDLHLHELDWQALLKNVQAQWALSGAIRCLSYNPPLWHLGESEGIPCCFAVLAASADVDEIFPFLHSASQSRLLIPSASDKIFSALTRAGLEFQVLDSSPTNTFSVPGNKPESPYRIVRLAKGWKIVFSGQEAILTEQGGMRFVEYLLKNPPVQPIHVLELEAVTAPVSKVFSGPQEIVHPETEESVSVDRTAILQERNLGLDDAETQRALWAVRKESQAILDNPLSGPRERAVAQKSVEDIDAFLKRNGVKETSGAKASYDRVRKAFSRLLKLLKEFRDQQGRPEPVFIQFAEHLDEYLIQPSRRYSGTSRSRVRAKVAQTFTYEPPPGVTWTD